MYKIFANYNGLRSLTGYSPWGHKELDRTEQLTLSLIKLKKAKTVLILRLSWKSDLPYMQIAPIMQVLSTRLPAIPHPTSSPTPGVLQRGLPLESWR